MDKGWECPKCKKVYAPFVRECDNCGKSGTFTPTDYGNYKSSKDFYSDSLQDILRGNPKSNYVDPKLEPIA